MANSVLDNSDISLAIVNKALVEQEIYGYLSAEASLEEGRYTLCDGCKINLNPDYQ
jgi:hypothetical protein